MSKALRLFGTEFLVTLIILPPFGCPHHGVLITITHSRETLIIVTPSGCFQDYCPLSGKLLTGSYYNCHNCEEGTH